MTYNQQDQSLTGGAPFYLYRFTRDGVNYQYTSLDSDLDLGGALGLFSASSLSHGGIKVGGPSKKDSLELIFPLSDNFAQLFLGRVVKYLPTSLTIWRAHWTDNDNELVVVFKGKVKEAGPKGSSSIALKVSSIFAETAQLGVGNVIQRPCRHSLYHGRCNLDRANFAVSANVTAIDQVNSILTVNEAASSVDSHYNYGLLDYQGALYFILRHVAASITLRALPQSLITDFEAIITPDPSLSITIYPGCDRSLATCRSKFENWLNYGGFPFMPDVDPFSNGSIV